MKKVLALGLSSVFVLALAPVDKSTIRLHVIDSATKKNIGQAAITYDKNFKGLTANDGGFLIYSQPVGSSHYLVVYKKGYKAYSNPAFVIDQKHTSVDIALIAQ